MEKVPAGKVQCRRFVAEQRVGPPRSAAMRRITEPGLSRHPIPAWAGRGAYADGGPARGGDGRGDNTVPVGRAIREQVCRPADGLRAPASFPSGRRREGLRDGAGNSSPFLEAIPRTRRTAVGVLAARKSAARG